MVLGDQSASRSAGHRILRFRPSPFKSVDSSTHLSNIGDILSYGGGSQARGQVFPASRIEVVSRLHRAFVPSSITIVAIHRFYPASSLFVPVVCHTPSNRRAEVGSDSDKYSLAGDSP